MNKTLTKNAEVTKRGIKARGSPDPSSKLVVNSTTHAGLIKKRLMYAGTTVLALAVELGLYLNWEPYMIHPAYWTGAIWLTQMLLLRFTKME